MKVTVQNKPTRIVGLIAFLCGLVFASSIGDVQSSRTTEEQPPEEDTTRGTSPEVESSKENSSDEDTENEQTATQDEENEQTATQDEVADETRNGHVIGFTYIDEEGQERTVKTSTDRILELLSELGKQNSAISGQIKTISEYIVQSQIAHQSQNSNLSDQDQGKDTNAIPDAIVINCNEEGGIPQDQASETGCTLAILIKIPIIVIPPCMPCSDGTDACPPKHCPPSEY
jgi:hypothetical protein